MYNFKGEDKQKIEAWKAMIFSASLSDETMSAMLKSSSCFGLDPCCDVNVSESLCLQVFRSKLRFQKYPIWSAFYFT